MKIPEETLTKIKSLQALIGIKELELEALKGHMAELIRESVGVDTSKGDWILDTEHGSLVEGTE